ncbi:hypothetical protein ASPSYDRAFT_618244 [Aspergillus sydowii CBS 593.65]|uniref:Uncharacterized protein n=1 Tax=Aspergillus sydowii CBS 593.65 TaxID=1036612 RepID=A0A1L9TRW1_9EURO|nr:uncharacterized protein ASPSYDRAFT_618244 [Aspergillus sydowii CBS 593.65]OJJ62172.1 hypothetical protein ASPSYDRAFT_618244 [Aspergillus sydowii CBS 593.65]
MAVNVRASFTLSCLMMKSSLHIGTFDWITPASLGGEVGATREAAAPLLCIVDALCTLTERGIYSSTIESWAGKLKKKKNKKIKKNSACDHVGLESGGVRCLSSEFSLCDHAMRQRVLTISPRGTRHYWYKTPWANETDVQARTYIRSTPAMITMHIIISLGSTMLCRVSLFTGNTSRRVYIQ